MTEYFRIEGLNDINFDQAATGPYRLTDGEPPRNMSSPMTRDQVLMELTRLPKGVRGQALSRGMSKVSFPFNIQADTGAGETDADMERYLHDFVETLQDGQLYVETEGVRGTQAVVRYKADGAVSDSYKTVWYGYIEEQAGRDLLGARIKEHYLENLQVTLYMEPMWRPDSAIPLGPNEIYCSSFEEDGNADGRADDWGVMAAPVLTMEGTIVLHGCYSQKVASNAVGEGLDSTIMVAPAAPANDAVAYVWVCRPAAGTDIRADIFDATAVATRAQADYSAATTIVTVGGYEWRRLELIATNNIIAGNNHQLRVYSLAADVTDWYLDKCFWKWDTTTIPDEWCDHWKLYNHYDTTEGAAHEGHQNYFDVDDLKGDTEARVHLEVEFDVKADQNEVLDLLVARRTQVRPCQLPWWLEAEDRTNASNWATAALARCSAGNRVTNAANIGGWVEWQFAASPELRLGLYDVYGAVYTDDIDNTSYRLYYAKVGVASYNQWVKQTVASKWQLVHLGTIDLRPYRYLDIGITTWLVVVEYQKDAADTVELDFIWWLPRDEPETNLECLEISGIIVGNSWSLQDVYDFDSWHTLTNTGLWDLPVARRGELISLTPRRENRLYMSCISRDVADRIWECHGAATDLQLRCDLSYLPQYVTPLE